MGSEKSGNKEPREKSPPEMQSRLVQFRLNPKNQNERWALERIDYYKAQGEGLKELFMRLLRDHENAEYVEPTVIASAGDVVDIKQIVQYIADKIESGELGSSNGKRRRKPEPEIPISNATRAMLDRHLVGGLLEDDD